MNLTACSRFMAGLDNNRLGIGNSRAHFPKLIAKHVHQLLDLTNAFSHTEGEDKEASKLQLKEYRSTVNSPYLLYGSTFLLIDVLLWFKDYADKNPDVRANQAEWKVEPQPASQTNGPISGRVMRIHSEKGIGEFISDSNDYKAFIPRQIITEHSVRVNMNLEVWTTPSNQKGKNPVVVQIRILE